MAYCTRCDKEVEATQGMECAVCQSSLMAERPGVFRALPPAPPLEEEEEEEEEEGETYAEPDAEEIVSIEELMSKS